VLYAVEFQASGLADGTTWNVSAGPVFNLSSSDLLTLWLPNGTYNYTIQAVSGYGAVAPGTVVVNGSSPAEILVPFVATPGGTSTVLGLPTDEGFGLLAVLIAVVVLGLGVLWWRRSRPPSETDDSPAPGGPIEPEDPSSLDR
jgi:hypothetical protein